MVALEAWALGEPVLANGRCDVLKGQCIRSSGGPVLRELRGVRRGALRARVERPAARPPRPERPRVLRQPLRLAGHRAQVPRHARATAGASRPGARRSSRCPGGSRDAGRIAAPPPSVLAGLPAGAAIDRAETARSGMTAHDRAAARAPGPRDARLRRRDRPRGARHPARAPRRRATTSEIFVETADPRLEPLTLDYRDMIGDGRAARRR